MFFYDSKQDHMFNMINNMKTNGQKNLLEDDSAVAIGLRLCDDHVNCSVGTQSNSGIMLGEF